MADLGAYFAQQTEEDAKKRQASLNNAPSERSSRRIEYPGHYVVKVGEFVWFDKKDPTHPIATPSPEVKVSRKGALLLNCSMQVSDKGTNLVPPGASIFHTITLLPIKGADEKKIDNTFRFMKPQMSALLGSDKIAINPEWLNEYCCIEFEEKAGKIVITKHHKLLKEVYITVDFVADLNNKPKLKVIKMDKLLPGDKSVTRKYTDDELKQLGKTAEQIPAEQADPGDVNPSDDGGSEQEPAKTTGVDTSKVSIRTEEDF